MLFREENQITGSADKKTIVTGGSFKSFADINIEDVELYLEIGHKSLSCMGEMLIYFLGNREGHFLVGESSDRLSVVNESGVVHDISSLNLFLYGLIIEDISFFFRDKIT